MHRMRDTGETHKFGQATIREQYIDDVADDASSYRTQVNHLLRRLMRRARALRGSEEAPPLVRRKLSQIDG